MAIDYDSPWKDALNAYFKAFLALLFPEIHALIDWSRGYEPLDKEFQQVVREAEIGRRYVDQLVKVWIQDGTECWVLIHVEVQTTRDADFPSRMYIYNYRVFDRYNKPVASLAVLADNDPTWRPIEFRNRLFGCEAGICFPSVKLLDLTAHEAELETSANPFAKVVLAHLKARQTHGDPAGRHAWKLRLVRGLYERGFRAKDVRELFRLIDWMMHLPQALEQQFHEELCRFEQEKQMPYVSSIERAALEKGKVEGKVEGEAKGKAETLLQVLKRRFEAELPADLDTLIRSTTELSRLEQWVDLAFQAGSLEEFRRLGHV